MVDDMASFTVSYEGDALDTHAMDVRDLAPALLSIGQLLEEANRVLNGDRVSIKLKVTALQEGSFEINFEAIQTLAAPILGFLSGAGVTSVLNLKELIFLGTKGTLGLFSFLKKLGGRTPTQTADLENGKVLIKIGDESMEVSVDVLTLSQSLSVRLAVQKTLKPLENEGIDSFSIKDNGDLIERIEKKECCYFKVPDTEEKPLLENTHKAAYSIVSLTFKDDNKWRLSDGNVTITASIKDEVFLNKVNNSLVSFTKGDVLICQVKTSQWQTLSGVKTSHEVLEIIDHKPALKQQKISFESIDEK